MPTTINILNSTDAKMYDLPPIFDGDQRKKFFDLPKWANESVESLRTPTNKMGFIGVHSRNGKNRTLRPHSPFVYAGAF